MKKILFIHSESIIINKTAGKAADPPEIPEFYPGVMVNLHRIATELDFELVLLAPSQTIVPAAYAKMLNILKGEDIVFREIVTDSQYPDGDAGRSQLPASLLKRYRKRKYDWANSYMVGISATNLQLVRSPAASMPAEFSGADAVLSTQSWKEIYRFLRFPPRFAEIIRKTSETEIHICLNLDGEGKANIHTGLGFFDHMLAQLAKHSRCDLKIHVNGDLETDEHHTIEDTALVLGEAFSQALGEKRGIERYGFLLPMDDALAQAALDFSGRSWLVWKVKFKREKIGEVPTEMFHHFFKSFCDTAKCNLNIRAKGKNEHHKIEAVFKAVGKAIRQAIRRSADYREIPSTKGIL